MAAELDLKKIISKLRSTIGGEFGRESLQLLGERAAEIIRRRTRLGYGVRRQLGERFRLAALSPRYIEYRAENREILSEFTAPRKSNLTLTGEMLDDLQPIRYRRNSVTLGFKSSAARKKAEWVSRRRPFLAMSQPEFRQLLRYKQQELTRALKAKRL